MWRQNSSLQHIWQRHAEHTLTGIQSSHRLEAAGTITREEERSSNTACLACAAHSTEDVQAGLDVAKCNMQNPIQS